MEFIINKYYVNLFKSLLSTSLLLILTIALYMSDYDKDYFFISWLLSLIAIFLLITQAVSSDVLISRIQEKTTGLNDKLI